jgi:aldehyde:ferredoxin oxidoreductase
MPYEIKDLWPDDFSKRKVKQLGCNRCPISCRRLLKVEQGDGEILHDGPEYECIYALGANCGIYQADSVVQLDYLCSEYGLDAISTGVTLSFMMECYEKGLVNRNDLDGIDLAFGSAPQAGEIIKKIARREGIGDLLSRGTYRTSLKIGGGSSSFAMAVKGLELPGYDPRGMKAMALLYATADRGGCHVRGSTLRAELLGLSQKFERFSYEGKVDLAVQLQREYALLNSFSICLFANFALSFKEYLEAVNQVFSCSWTLEELKEAGARIWNMTRLFNCREGFSRKDDILPGRLFYEPLTEGASKGEVVDLQKFRQMLDEYYLVQGWDQDGIPRQSMLEMLEIDEFL